MASSFLPPEIWRMVWDFALDQELEENPRIYQLKRVQDPYTGMSKISLHGQKPTMPVLLAITSETRRLAKQHYVRVLNVLPNLPGVWRSGGLWLRPSKDIVYIDTTFARMLPWFSHFDLGFIERVAVDIHIINEPDYWSNHESAMGRLIKSFPSIKHMVFFAPTKVNPPGNSYKGLRLVDKMEDEVSKSLPFSRFYQSGGSTGGIMQHTGILHFVVFWNEMLPYHNVVKCDLRNGDEFRRVLEHLDVCIPVVVFQRQGMRAPRTNTATGPACLYAPALGRTHHRSRLHQITETQLTELLEGVEFPASN